MARFIFSLQPLLQHRLHIEKEHQRKVAEIQQQANELRNHIQETQRRILEQNRKLTADQLLGPLDLAYIANEKRYVNTLQLVIVNTLQRLTLVERSIAAARAELLEAARARKVIEKLREKHFTRWREELDRKEIAELDEIGTQLALRQLAAEEM